MLLDGKKIIITGASSGIGEATLKELLKYDVEIVAANRNINNFPIQDSRLHIRQCDVSNPEEIDRLFEFALKTMGVVDIFIANAGFAYYEKIENADWDRTESIVRTNFISPVYTIGKMAEVNPNREYNMVMTASAMAKLPIPGYARYAATKAAIDAFSYAYRFEQQDQGHLSVVYPIATRTNFFNTAGDATPVPWPSQSSEAVAKAVVKGIIRSKQRIYPSKTFVLMMWINRILPFALDLYARAEALKFHRLRRNKRL